MGGAISGSGSKSPNNVCFNSKVKSAMSSKCPVPSGGRLKYFNSSMVLFCLFYFKFFFYFILGKYSHNLFIFL